MEEEASAGFACFSQSFVNEPGVVISLVEEKSLNLKLLSYNSRTNSFKTLANFGKWI